MRILCSDNRRHPLTSVQGKGLTTKQRGKIDNDNRID